MSKERALLKEIIRHFAEGGLAIIASNSDVGKTLHNAKELLAQPEPFKPDWANYRQGVADSKREPLSDTRCPYPEETSGEYRDGFTDGILYAEKHHGIGGIDDYRAKVGLDE